MPKLPKLFPKQKSSPYTTDVQASTSDRDHTDFEPSNSVANTETNILKPMTELSLNEIINRVQNINLENNLIEDNLNIIQNNNSSTMATITVLDLLKNITCFDGTPGTLNRFLRNADRIINTSTEATKEMVTDMVRNKITGKANDMLISVADPSNWTTIKNHLVTQFSDRRTVETILHKLNTISQGQKTLETYYAEVSDLQTALLNSIDQLKSQDYIAGQTDMNIMIVLKSFIAGLDPKLGYIVRANKPSTIKDAYDTCLNEISMQQSSYDRSRLTNRNTPNYYNPQPTIRKPIPNTRQQLQPPRFNYTPQYAQQPYIPPQFNAQPFKQQSNSPMHNQNPLYKTQQPTYRPTTFTQQYRPQQSNQPFFNRPQQSNQPSFNRPQPNLVKRPTPMDVSSGNTRQVIHNY